MKTYRIILALSMVLLLFGCATPQPPTPTVYIGPTTLRFRGNTIPPNPWVYEESKSSGTMTYARALTGAEIQAGSAELPRLIFEDFGYEKYVYQSEPVILDSETLALLRSGGYLQNKTVIRLQKKPEPPPILIVQLTINSEPEGARVWSEGKRLGITPLIVDYEIKETNYTTGKLKCPPLIVVADGCLPARQDLELQVESRWTNEVNVTHEYATLFLLKRDPDFKPPVIVQQQSPPVIVQQQPPQETRRDSDVNVIIKKEKDELDILQQMGQLGILFKALQPVR